ncbi:rRNA adenine dimethylase [Tothia fuscella]|uniref:rRNA adenine N(6)-methyltransferase n=1 Tax=Tothia fuscella TaxID=1048955 RepID=A0A9P4TUE1_9PEZI|nr:rRNA adenine dimethylase [Tothia fuscella]
MPKSASKKGSAGRSSPYSKDSSTKTKAAHSIFKMNTDLGQHILKNPGVADAIVAKASLKQSDIVLEVGPGTGNLTTRILSQVKKCIAVEMDPRMAAELTKRVQGTPSQKKLDVLLGDVIKTTLPYFDVCISNTPYQISSPLVFKLLAQQPAPRVCLLMFQREFAMRLFAKPGDKLYSRLSVNAQMWAKIDHVMRVGKANFNPPPQVESSVVRITPIVPRPRIGFEEWDGLLRICFVRKNKTLRSSFLGTTSVMALIESNYRTWCAQNDVILDDSPLDTQEEEMAGVEEEEDEWEGFMDVDEDEDKDDLPEFFKEERARRAEAKRSGTKRKRKGRVSELVRQKVLRVLEGCELSEKRARMCDQNDFLRMLEAFNGEGIHFA